VLQTCARLAAGPLKEKRSAKSGTPPSLLLLKLLFTSQPLSIQVHPGDAYARSIGLQNGKTEAWHVLHANSDGKVGLGLKRRLTEEELRRSIYDGSISDLILWRTVVAGDSIFVPAGTIHAIGAGLVIAEIQQRSDATFRLFDFGRERELHVEDAVAVGDAGPADTPIIAAASSDDARTTLMSNGYFTFEKIDLVPGSTWYVDAEQETWLLVVSGTARIGSFDVVAGDAIFAQLDRVAIVAGLGGVVGLVAYTGNGAIPNLLHKAMPASTSIVMETIQ
jgi:mannose-6-phosphate isomerase